MKNKKKQFIILFAGAIILLWGCSGGSDNEVSVVVPDTVEISGTVATGAPLTTATVSVVNSLGQSTGPVNVNLDGSYSLFVNEGAPYLLQANSEAENVTLFSYSAGKTQTNITSLTNLALFVAVGLEGEMSERYKNWQNNPIEESDVSMATRTVNANFVDLYKVYDIDADTYNFFDTPFTADSTGIDGVLDTLDINIDPYASTTESKISIIVSGESNIIFNPYVDISDFYLIERITPDVAYETLISSDALLVCSYNDSACEAIMIENALYKSELEQLADTLPKSQTLIFY